MNQPQTERAHLDREFAFRPQDFAFIAKLVRAQSGIVLAEHKVDMVYGRIARRLRQLGLTSFADYCRLLESAEGESEMGNFVNALTTNLTSFFRESHHFTHLREVVLPAILADPPPGRRLRLWSAACSSGAEAYSMAMVCHDAIPDIEQWDLRILATDIDTAVLARAAAGEYPADDVASVPANYSSRYITPSRNGQIRMNSAIRELIRFKPLNLIGHWPMSGQFNVVFCRNVVIYFDADTQRQLFERIAGHMPVGSWLYIGHSENLHNISDRFVLQGKTIYRRKA